MIRKVASSYNIQPSQVEVYELTKDGTHIAYGAIFARSSNAGEIATFLGDNWNTDGCTYLLSDTELTLGSSITVTIDQDLTTNAPASHTHNWTPATSGNGTNQAATVITCSGCSETMTVTLTASNVTLPGDVFTAKISTETGISPIARSFQLPEGLTVSDTPGYKYSATGSDFTSIDPNNFTPKQGIYQASILVNGAGWNQPENLYVTYTVSDPAVTVATGDNRPIEMMVMGIACFSILAIAAFVLDGKRKACR